MALNAKQLERYNRQILMNGFGLEGQQKISRGKVLIIGIGGLGSPVALYLAAAGIGTLGLVDGDRVELSNLQRQVVHFTPDLGDPKVISAKEKIKKLNPDVRVVPCHQVVDPGNIIEIIKEYDFVIDATDNFPAKYLINDACVLAKKPFSHGGVLRLEGQTITHVPGNSCFRCIFPTIPCQADAPKASQAGILGSVAGIIGTIQATEAIKFLSGIGKLLTNKLLSFSAADMSFRGIEVKKNDKCPVCGNNPRITELKMERQPGL